MPDAAPHPALQAAKHLAAQGEHVHYVAEGQVVCLSHTCGIDSILTA